MQIRDRIKELRRVKASELLPNPKNWRTHPVAQQDALRGVLAEVGYADALIARETPEGLMLVDGHLRAETTPDADVPVLVLDINEAEADLMLATLDPLAAMAGRDEERLDELLATVTSGNDTVNALLQSLANGYEPLTLLEPDPPDEGFDIDDALDDAEADDYEPTVQRGEVWSLGDHRLMCGDSTQDNDVLMNGDRAALGLTSPPYAVGKEYEAGTSFDDHIEMLNGVADVGLEAIEEGGFFFVNFGEIAPQSHAGPLTGSKRQCLYLISKDYWHIFRERAYDLYAQRIWYKPFNRLQQPFWTYHTGIPHYQEWEHLWTWRLPGGSGDEVHDWDISSRAVWDTRNESTDDHPLTRHTAAFPVGIPERALRAHSDPGAMVWDPFCGSGTTIAASERTGRICYGMEIEPKYVAVTLERMAGMGLEPRLAE